MKRILIVLMILGILTGCTGGKKDPAETTPTPVPTASSEPSGQTVKPTSDPDHGGTVPFSDEAIDQARQYMAPAKLGVIYAGTLYGNEQEVADKFDVIAQRYPFLLNMDESQLVLGDVPDEGMIMVLILIPEENATVSINSLRTGEVLYRDEFGTPVVYMGAIETGNPTIEVNVVADGNDIGSIEPALSLYDGHLRENMNMLILDLSDYDWLYDNSDVPFYQQACFDNIMYRDDVLPKVESGKQLLALWDMNIDGDYYLCFGLGDDPHDEITTDCYYASRPGSPNVYYSENLTEWTLLD